MVARAWVSDPNPLQCTKETIVAQFTVDGVGVPGVPATFRWHYRKVTRDVHVITDDRGVAWSTRFISGATPGYIVLVDVEFSYQGRTYGTQTAFTPRPNPYIRQVWIIE